MVGFRVSRPEPPSSASSASSSPALDPPRPRAKDASSAPERNSDKPPRADLAAAASSARLDPIFARDWSGRDDVAGGGRDLGEDDSDPPATESTRAVNQLAPDADVDDLDGDEGPPATVPARPRTSRGDETFAFGFVRVRDVSRAFDAAFGACPSAAADRSS